MADELAEKKAETPERIPDVRVYEAAICFARMWGIMETLEPLPNLRFEEVRNIVVELAEEFVAGKGEDLAGFFMERVKELKIKYCSRAHHK